MLEFKEFCDLYDLDTWVAVVYDAEQLREDGHIGDCVLRYIATLWQKNLNFHLGHASALRIISDEGYRRLALELLDLET